MHPADQYLLGMRWREHYINLQCDNANFAIVINNGLSKDKFVVDLLRSIIFVAHFDICITGSHLPGVISVTANHLSWQHVSGYEVTPTLMQHPAIIPSSAFRLLSPHTLKWIPLVFCSCFK